MCRLCLDAIRRAWPGALAFIRSNVLNPSELTERIRDASKALGLSVLGCAPVQLLSEGRNLRAWLARGYQADMRWMENPELREDPSRLAPMARSIVAVGIDCGRPSAEPQPGMGRIANFAMGKDYHDVLGVKLAELGEFLGKIGGGDANEVGRIAIDSAPLLERAIAMRAGLGWIGRNCCLISPRYGSWLLLGELLVPAVLEYGRPYPNRCGNCKRCQDACPTGALVAPGILDSSRCIAYLTVEAKGSIPMDLRPQVGNWLFGCDACQNVCPWNRMAARGRSYTEDPPAAAEATRFLLETEDSFRRRYRGTALFRTGRSRMARNAAVVLGNADDVPMESLRRGMQDPDPLVRRHVAWALGRQGDFKILAKLINREKDHHVRAEIDEALKGTMA